MRQVISSIYTNYTIWDTTNTKKMLFFVVRHQNFVMVLIFSVFSLYFVKWLRHNIYIKYIQNISQQSTIISCPCTISSCQNAINRCMNSFPKCLETFHARINELIIWWSDNSTWTRRLNIHRHRLLIRYLHITTHLFLMIIQFLVLWYLSKVPPYLSTSLRFLRP